MNVASPSVQRRNLAVLIAAQAFLGAQMPLIFTIGGLAISENDYRVDVGKSECFCKGSF